MEDLPLWIRLAVILVLVAGNAFFVGSEIAISSARRSRIRQLAEEEIQNASARRDALELELQKLLLPRDPRDASNVFLEIRAGTGGDEAAIFAGDLFRMYARSGRSRWRACS